MRNIVRSAQNLQNITKQNKNNHIIKGLIHFFLMPVVLILVRYIYMHDKYRPKNYSYVHVPCLVDNTNNIKWYP